MHNDDYYSCCGYVVMFIAFVFQMIGVSKIMLGTVRDAGDA